MSGWACVKDVGWAREFESDAHPGWSIYDQPAGFFVWRGFSFFGSRQLFKEAVELVEEHS